MQTIFMQSNQKRIPETKDQATGGAVNYTYEKLSSLVRRLAQLFRFKFQPWDGGKPRDFQQWVVGFNHPLPGKIQQQQAGGPRLETRVPKKWWFFIPPKTTPLKINGWNIIPWRFGRSCSFLNWWFIGSMLIFQGVTCLLKRDYFSKAYIWTNHFFSRENRSFQGWETQKTWLQRLEPVGFGIPINLNEKY